MNRSEDVTTYSDRLFLNFWIDAICIDQNNTQERSAQVARMREIYSKAISPLIWLGVANLPTSDANGVIDLIRDIRVIVEPHLQGNIEWSDVVEKITSESFLTSRIESVREFRKLVGRDWFSRIWIIQEAGTANASSVALIRFQPVPWIYLTEIVLSCCHSMADASLFTEGILFRKDTMNLVVLRDITRYTNEKRALALSLENHSSQHVVERLYDLLHDTCGIFKATDPHDLVYGLPGLLGATIPNEIYPDYSLSVSKVFHQYTMYMIKGTNTLDFLCSLKRDLPDVPSWVSDWRHTIFNEKGSKKSFAGSLDTGISEDGEQLIVSGVCLGQVARVVYPTAIAGAITATQIGADIDHPNQQSTEDAPNDVARHVLTIFRGMQELKRSCILHFTSATTGYWKQYWGQLWLQDMEECQNLFELLESTSELRLEEIVRYKPAAILMIIGDTIRRLARTGFAILEGGQLIDTSRIDEPILDGDLICFLRGMTRPCILRKARQYFTLVGGCNMSSFKEDSLIELLLSRIGLIGLF